MSASGENPAAEPAGERGALLAPDEPQPYELIEAGGDRPVVLACDHAHHRLPRALGTLGIAEEYSRDHIAWDIGAAAVTRYLSQRLRASALLGAYSRLAVDLNRSLSDPTAFPAISDGVLIPGNLSLSAEAKAERARTLFAPYHGALRRTIASRSAPRERPVLIAVHSFTPYLHGIARPWQIGILWDKDPRLPLPLLEALRAARGVVVADNEPYSGRHPADFTVDHHAEPLGLAHAGIEIRQDLIEDEAGQLRWAQLLGEVLELVLGQAALYRPSGRREVSV